MLDNGPHALDGARVADCMRHGIVSCVPETPLPDVAAMMSSRRIHAIAVRDATGTTYGIISASDLAAAAARGRAASAGEVAGTRALWVSGERSLRAAALLMAEHGATHLLVRDHGSGHPQGVLSTSDIVSAYAGTRGLRSPA